MCGWSGFLGPSDSPRLMLDAMNRILAHRGPDDSGVWVDSNAQVGLAHRRLSIIDLSASGHQPMTSGCGRYVIAYNGEVYNFRHLRQQLLSRGCEFRGDSDTEVVLAAISEFGVETAVSQFVGMFSFALWDREEQRLTLCRDRLGIKPLYHAVIDDCCYFASELKAFRALKKWSPTVDRQSLQQLLSRGYIMSPRTIFEGVSRLLPAHLANYRLRHGRAVVESIKPFWRLADKVGRRAIITAEDRHVALDRFRTQLAEAVEMRMVSDVPLGALLSGGIDSTLVTALMQSASITPIKTFSIGFSNSAFNEAPYAKRIAEYLGTEHHEEYLSDQHLIDLVPKLPQIFDEPFGDDASLPTVLLAALARKDVTVALGGDGGDELAGGYVRHAAADRLHSVVSWLPKGPRRLLGRLLVALPETIVDGAYARVRPLLGHSRQMTLPGDKFQKLGRAIMADDPRDIYDAIVNQRYRTEPVLGLTRPNGIQDRWWHWPDETLSPAESVIFQDTMEYLPDEVLMKADRASMLHSLELRVPLLDHRLIELSWQMPVDMKIRGGSGKWMLRQILSDLVPSELWNRPKMGFSSPVSEWLRGPLHDWAHDLLSESRLRREGYLDYGIVAQQFRMHEEGRLNAHQALWNLLAFQSWLDNWQKV